MHSQTTRMGRRSLNHETIILIGPEGAGKTTVAKLLAEQLSKELFSLDRHRRQLYAPYGYDEAYADGLYKDEGEIALLQYWNYFEYRATVHILQNAFESDDEFFGKILDFGAGHSVYEAKQELHHVMALSEQYANIYLLLPCEDVDEAVKITEHRRGHALGYNRFFMEHPSNKSISKYILYTKDKEPRDSAAEVMKHIVAAEYEQQAFDEVQPTDEFAEFEDDGRNCGSEKEEGK
jgi:energy-coupling factor transporter ATP-binding protein EcfA2